MAFDPDEIETLTEALQSVLTLKHGGRGTLQIAAGATKGCFSIFNGFIVAARVSGTQLQDDAAVDHLMALDECVVSFAEDEALSVEEVTCHISLKKLLKARSEHIETASQETAVNFMTDTKPIPEDDLDALVVAVANMSEVKNLQDVPSADHLPEIDPEVKTLQDVPSAHSLPEIDPEVKTLQDIPSADSLPDVDPEVKTLQDIPSADSLPDVDPEVKTLEDLPAVEANAASSDNNSEIPPPPLPVAELAAASEEHADMAPPPLPEDEADEAQAEILPPPLPPEELPPPIPTDEDSSLDVLAGLTWQSNRATAPQPLPPEDNAAEAPSQPEPEESASQPPSAELEASLLEGLRSSLTTDFTPLAPEEDNANTESHSEHGKAPTVRFASPKTTTSEKKPTSTFVKLNALSKRTAEMAAQSPAPTSAQTPDLSSWTSKGDRPAINLDETATIGEISDNATIDVTPSDGGFQYVNIADTQARQEGDADWEDGSPPEPSAENVESSLREDQRRLLEQVSMLSDPELFNEKSAELEQASADVSLAEKAQELLKEVKIVNDPKVWEELSPELQKPQEKLELGKKHKEMARKAKIDKRSIEARNKELADRESLDDSQKELLDLVSNLADEEGFVERDDILSLPNEVVIQEEERWALEQLATAKSAEQQKSEFAVADPILAAENERAVLKEFADYQLLEDIPTPDVDERPAVVVLPEDHEPILPEADATHLVKKARGGLIGRLQDVLEGRKRHKIGRYEGPLPSAGPSLTHLVGPSILFTLFIALFTVPAMLRTSTSRADSPDLAQQQMRLIVEDEMNDSIPYAQHDVMKEIQAPYAGMLRSKAPDTSGGSVSGRSTDSLMSARWLAGNGHPTEAAKEYEKYLDENPDSVSVRVELITFLLSQGNNERARWHCLRGMKSKCSPTQLEQFWALWRRAVL